MAINPYGLHDLPAVGGGLPGLPRRQDTSGLPSWALRGEAIFESPGIHKFRIPPGVYSICAVCVGAGQAQSQQNPKRGGSGGGLAWKNNIPVVPGQVIDIQVAGTVGTSTVDISFAVSPEIVAASSGSSHLSPGLFLAGDGGGNGGIGGSGSAGTDTSGAKGGGGGAGGYSGDGGAGASGLNTSNTSGADGSGGGGGGGSGVVTIDTTAGGGGGVGIYGEGPSGAGGVPSNSNGSGPQNGFGGSGGQDGVNSGGWARAGNKYGGGARGSSSQLSVHRGGLGVVRILWGKGRAFPSTDVGPTY